MKEGNMFTKRLGGITLVALVALAFGGLGVSSSSALALFPTCGDEPATILGTEGNDTLMGTPEDDVIVSFGGDDVVVGAGGFDLICAGEGNDSIVVNGGAFWDGAAVWGGAGDDRLQGSSDAILVAVYEDSTAPVTVDMGARTATGWGNDTLIQVDAAYGSKFDDILIGSRDDDVLMGSDGNDAIKGLGGEDIVSGDAGDDTVDGGSGRDDVVFEFAPKGVRVNLGTGIATGWGRDTLRSIEEVYGSAQADVLIGGRGADQLEGNGGNDQLIGNAGRDRLYGGKGKDRADGGAARDDCRAERKVRCP